jgi:phage-related protein
VKPKFNVIFLEEAKEFIDKLDSKAREKVIYNIHKARLVNDNELFKKLTGEIWEFRTIYSRKKYRLLAFWDKFEKVESIVISTHGFIKKTDKTPQSDLDKAEKIRKQYFEQKTKTK